MMNLPTAWEQLTNRVLTVEQIRAVDRQAIEKYHMHSLVLMENAALGCVHWLNSHFGSGTTAVILCGRGNNGGDGLAIARHLRVLGWRCRVLLLGPTELLSQDARANWQILESAGGHDLVVWHPDGPNELPTFAESWFASANVVLDAMLGTGASGNPRAPFCDWITLANASHAQRIAIDIPTGWDAMTGTVAESTFLPHATLTFVAKKPAMVAQGAAQLLGEIVVLPIGIPEEHIRELLGLEPP